MGGGQDSPVGVQCREEGATEGTGQAQTGGEAGQRAPQRREVGQSAGPRGGGHPGCEPPEPAMGPRGGTERGAWPRLALTWPQVRFNVAAAQCRLGLRAEAARSLEDAVSEGPEGAHRDLGAALARVQVRGGWAGPGRPLSPGSRADPKPLAGPSTHRCAHPHGTASGRPGRVRGAGGPCARVWWPGPWGRAGAPSNTPALEVGAAAGGGGQTQGRHVPGPLQEQGALRPRSVPRGEVFRPPRRYLEHLEPMDFLGKAKVRAASRFSGHGPSGARGPSGQRRARPVLSSRAGGARPAQALVGGRWVRGWGHVSKWGSQTWDRGTRGQSRGPRCCPACRCRHGSAGPGSPLRVPGGGGGGRPAGRGRGSGRR